MLQSVQFDLIHQLESFAQLSTGKALLIKPHQVRLRQIHKTPALVFSKRHLHVHSLEQFAVLLLLVLQF